MVLVGQILLPHTSREVVFVEEVNIAVKVKHLLRLLNFFLIWREPGLEKWGAAGLCSLNNLVAARGEKIIRDRLLLSHSNRTREDRVH